VQNADFRDITKQILTASLDQHWKIMPRSCAMLPEGRKCWPRHQSIFVYCSTLLVQIKSWKSECWSTATYL